MFGRQSGLSSSGNSSNLVEFRAGRMNRIGKMVHPDTRKGLLYMQQTDDGLMHFCWKDRTSGRVEDDLIVFPDDFEFKRVEQCKTGRVYVLKCKTSKRMFFWMQEPKTDKDDEYCRRVNELLNNPPSHTRGGSNDNNDLQYMLNNMSQQQLMQLFGGVGQMGGLSSLLGSMNRNSDSTRTPSSNRNSGSSSLTTPENSGSSVLRTPSAPKGKTSKTSSGNNGTGSGSGSGSGTATVASTGPANVTGTGTGTTATSGTVSGSGSGTATDNNSKTGNTENGGKENHTSNVLFSTNDFQTSYLTNLSPEAGSSRSLEIDLSAALAGSDAINQLITDPELAKQLSVHLPETDNNDETRKQQIKEHIQSPQFQQALTMFTNALQSAQLGPVVSQFELPADAVAAAYSGNLEDFVKALEKALPEGTTMGSSSNSETTTSNSTPTSSSSKDTTKSNTDANTKTDDKKTE